VERHRASRKTTTAAPVLRFCREGNVFGTAKISLLLEASCRRTVLSALPRIHPAARGLEERDDGWDPLMGRTWRGKRRGELEAGKAKR